MSSTPPKRPTSPPALGSRPPNPVVSSPSARPANMREAVAEAYAVGGGAVVRASAAPARPAGPKTILIVDPDPSIRARMRALLEPQYAVIEAADGLEAVEIARAGQPPAMVVSDTTMPRLDGFTFAKILRSDPLTKRVPIMFVSAQHDPQHVTQALVIGVSQYLPKTTPVAQIVEKIRKIVQ